MGFVKRTLVVAPHLGVLASYAGALLEFTSRRSHVHIAVIEPPPPGAEVDAFIGKFRHLTFGQAPVPDRWAVLGAAVRGCLDCWNQLPTDEEKEHAWRRALEQAPPLAARLANDPVLRSAVIRPLASRIMTAISRTIPVQPAIVEFLKAHHPDVLIPMPLFGIGSFVPDYLRAAAVAGVPTLGLVDRWDDLSHGALLHELPDGVVLWNRDQRRQAVEVRGVPARRTAIIGACLPLDVAAPVRSTREEYCARHRLDPARPLIVCAPRRGRDAARVARQWIESFGHRPEAVRGAQPLIVLMPPAGVCQRDDLEVPGLVIPGAATDPAQYADEVAEALHHGDVIVSSDVMMLLEAAARARPAVALVSSDDDDRDLARFCREHAARGWPVAAGGIDQLPEAIARVLQTTFTRVMQASARTLVRPHGAGLAPGFLMWVRLFQEVMDRRAERPRVPGRSTRAPLMLRPLARLAESRAAALPVRRRHPTVASVLVAAPSAHSLFLHQPLVRTLAERGHRVEVAFTARTEEVADAYERIKVDVPNVRTVGVLAPPVDMWGAIARGLHGVSAYLSLLNGVDPGQPALVRFSMEALPRGFRPFARIARRSPAFSRIVRRFVARLDRAVPSTAAARDLLRLRQPDVVVALPDTDVVLSLESAGARSDLMRSAASFGIPAMTCAIGPDALAHGTMLQPRADAVVVWNASQGDVVARDMHLSPPRIAVTGMPWLDRALDTRTALPREEFCALLGLATARPFALFVGSAGLMADPGREVDLVRRWLASLRDSADPRLRTLPVLLRPPRRSPRWRSLDISGIPDVVLCPRAYERSGELDAVLLVESVRHAAVVVSIDGLALTLAAAQQRPAVAVYRVDDARVSADDLPISVLWRGAGSSIRVAPTLNDLNAHVRATLNGEVTVPADTSFAELVRPRGACASTLMADRIEDLARRSGRTASERRSLGDRLLRLPLLIAAGTVSALGRVGGGDGA